AQERLEKPLCRGRERDRRQQRRPVPDRRVEPLGDERQRAVERDVEGERRVKDVRAAARLTQEGGAPDREGDDGRDQPGNRLNAQGGRILARNVRDVPMWDRHRTVILPGPTRPAMFLRVTNAAVLVLNRHYQPIHVTNVRRAFSLLYLGVA